MQENKEERQQRIPQVNNAQPTKVAQLQENPSKDDLHNT